MLNQVILVNQAMNSVECWFSLNVDLLAYFVMLIIVFICIVYRDYGNPILLAMVITQSLTIQETLIWTLKEFMYL